MEKRENQKEEVDTKQCPSCGETIKRKAFKCSHCKMMQESQHTAGVCIKTPELNWWKKILIGYWTSKKRVLDEFIVESGILTASNRAGKCIRMPLGEAKATFENRLNGIVWINVKNASGDSVRFGNYAFTVSEKEWERIMNTLQPKETKRSVVFGILDEILDD